MIINESVIGLYSERTSIEKLQEQERLTVWNNDGNDKSEVREGRGINKLKNGWGWGRRVHRDHGNMDKVKLSDQTAIKRRNLDTKDVELSDEERLNVDLNMRLLRELFEKITGRKFHMIDPISKGTGETSVEEVQADLPSKQDAAIDAAGSDGFGLEYDYHRSVSEFESTSFAAGGTITTADGMTIDFSLALNMSREFYSEENFSLRAGEALKDPLTVNFSGTAAQLTQREFSFDIDSDGHPDQISFVDPGSGFLALDKNNDGTINDGSELFGTASGDGFADLATYDEDGNNWIDENDSIFKNLRIWSKTADGEDHLVALGSVGIGALYLGHVETLFSQKDADNALLGQVKSTGLAVKESGEVVTMQQLDLVA